MSRVIDTRDFSSWKTISSHFYVLSRTNYLCAINRQCTNKIFADLLDQWRTSLIGSYLRCFWMRYSCALLAPSFSRTKYRHVTLCTRVFFFREGTEDVWILWLIHSLVFVLCYSNYPVVCNATDVAVAFLLFICFNKIHWK